MARVAIVTGAGGGLGRTYALDLAARGVAVVANDLGGAKDGTGGDVSAAQSNYGAAKMGLVGLSNVLALEGAKANIKSNVIYPPAATRMTEDLLGPLAGNLSPEKVTPMVVFLASEALGLWCAVRDLNPEPAD